MKYELARYNAYKDSGIEWLGDVPSDWHLNRHKDDFTFITVRCVNSSLEKIGLENIEGKTGRFISTESEFDGEGVEFKENDILFGKLRPYLAKVYLSEFCGNAVGDIFVYRLKRNTMPKFAQYLMLSNKYIDLINSSTVGAKMPRVSSSFIANLPISTPPLIEQKAITDFLDTKTAQIDRKIDLLTQKAIQYGKLKQSLINETVTRGLDKTVEMKDSGVEWIGEVPENWEMKRLKDIFQEKNGNGFPHEHQGNDYGEVPFYKVSDINGNDCFVSESKNYVSLKTAKEYKWNIILKNTIITAKIGESLKKNHRKIAINNCFIDNNCLGLFPICTDIKFSYYLLKLIDFNRFTNVGAVPSVSTSDMRSFLICLPPYSEQQAIADYLDFKTAHIDRIVETIHTQIGKLKELRKTLINDVVTGKIKVVREEEQYERTPLAR